MTISKSIWITSKFFSFGIHEKRVMSIQKYHQYDYEQIIIEPGIALSCNDKYFETKNEAIDFKINQLKLALCDLEGMRDE